MPIDSVSDFVWFCICSPHFYSKPHFTPKLFHCTYQYHTLLLCFADRKSLRWKWPLLILKLHLCTSPNIAHSKHQGSVILFPRYYIYLHCHTFYYTVYCIWTVLQIEIHFIASRLEWTRNFHFSNCSSAAPPPHITLHGQEFYSKIFFVSTFYFSKTASQIAVLPQHLHIYNTAPEFNFENFLWYFLWVLFVVST